MPLPESLRALRREGHAIEHEMSGYVPPQPIPSGTVDHPAYYGGADNPYEAIKVIRAWGLGFNLGNVVKYICRAGRKGDRAADLAKAAWYLADECEAIAKRRGSRAEAEHDR